MKLYDSKFSIYLVYILKVNFCTLHTNIFPLRFNELFFVCFLIDGWRATLNIYLNLQETGQKQKKQKQNVTLCMTYDIIDGTTR